MAYSIPLTKFAQSIYLVLQNRYYDDIDGIDGQDYISQVIDWTNMYLDELETLTDQSGSPVYWNWTRKRLFNLGTAVLGANSVPMAAPEDVVVITSDRPIQIMNNGLVVSIWAFVSPNQLDFRSYEQRVTRIGDELVFSRPFNKNESGGTISGDIVASITRLSDTSLDVLTTVKPKQLLILGVAKNSTLPDIVQGGLTPSYTQKYNDLLEAAITLNNASTESYYVQGEDYGFISGVGF